MALDYSTVSVDCTRLKRGHKKDQTLHRHVMELEDALCLFVNNKDLTLPLLPLKRPTSRSFFVGQHSKDTGPYLRQPRDERH